MTLFYFFSSLGDTDKDEKQTISIVEGSPYKVKIKFRVQREIVAGLRYKYSAYRKGIKVDSKF